VNNDVLFHRDVITGVCVEQLVVPVCKREAIVKIAHDADTSGHFGLEKTLIRINYSFY